MDKKKNSHSIFSDAQWCINNDFQVYVKPVENNKCRIAYRRGGITTEGKDKKLVNGSMFYSVEVEGEKVYRTQREAMSVVPDVYSYLRNKYGENKIVVDNLISKNKNFVRLINEFDLV